MIAVQAILTYLIVAFTPALSLNAMTAAMDKAKGIMTVQLASDAATTTVATGCQGLSESAAGYFCGYNNGEIYLGDWHTTPCQEQCTTYLNGREGCCRQKSNKAHCWVTVGGPPSVSVQQHSSSGFQAVMCNENAEATTTTTTLAATEDHHTALKGAGTGDPVCTADENTMAVRCCSDTSISGWSKKSGCTVWGGSDEGWTCQTLGFADAKLLCEAQGGRLCTAEEIATGCTKGTGCGFDHDIVWTSTYCEVCSTNCAACDGDTCTRCKNQNYLTLGGVCVEECPPGYTEQGAGDEGRTCQVCHGQSNRRRTGTTCDPCQQGHIDKVDADDCQNLQDTCTLDQCTPCATCLETLKAPMADCMTRSTGNCFHFGQMWCPDIMGRVVDCQGLSLGCFYKILCHSPCVCEHWKSFSCGGLKGGASGTCTSLLQAFSASETNQSAAAKQWMQKRTHDETIQQGQLMRRQQALAEAAPSAAHNVASVLDLSLSGKCAAG